MTREEKLWTMTGTTLLQVAENLGIKTTKSTLKKGKEKLIKKILEVENEKPVVEEPVIEEQKKTTEPKTIKKVKRVNLKIKELTYNNETKSIRDWATELNIPWPTLYDRVNRNGWTVEEAIETPLGQKRKK